MSLDEVDRKILSILKRDARVSYSDIGKEVNLSAPAVHARVKKLESQNIITSYTINLQPEALGGSICAFIRMAKSKGTSAALASELKKIKQIEECHSVAGEDCLILKLRVQTSLELSKILDRIREVDGIDRTNTAVVLETHFERGMQP